MAKFNKGDKKIYDQIYEGTSYFPTVGETYHNNRSKAKVVQFYLEEINKSKNPQVLDIGCYIGTVLFTLPKVNKNAKYVGIDISDGVISYAEALAKTRGERNITFLTHNANAKLPFNKNQFDIILCLELIEHVENPLEVFEDIKRILKPGGTLIVSTPNEGYLIKKLLKFIPSFITGPIYSERKIDFSRHGASFTVDPNVWDTEAHISLHDYSAWRKLMETAGFKVDKVEGSTIFGGSRFISERPFLLALCVFIDAVVDLLPLKPHLQMCLIMKLKK